MSRQAVSKWETGSGLPTMGASPQVNRFLEALLPQIGFLEARSRIGNARIAAVEDAQNHIVSLLSLS